MFLELYRNDNIVAGNSVRCCVDEKDCYDGFSVCGYTGDSVEHVAGCRRQLASFLDIDEARVVQCRQTHSSSVFVADADTITAGNEPFGYDAIVTNLKNVAIGINTADCVPILIFDKRAGIIGAVHAGWRGALAGIAVNALEKMMELGAGKDGMGVYFGPSIGECCFEVGNEVASQFPDEFVIHRAGEKPQVNLAAFVAQQLVDWGVNRERIVMNGNCTRCDARRYFSARALGVESGRVFTFIMMR